MAYHIHTTPGFVVSSFSRGEADKYIYVFTRDLGMIGIIAKGVRLEKSKLRYAVQDYAYGSFSVVRGKEAWRLTGAEVPDTSYVATPTTAQILALLRRLVQGEEAQPVLFDLLSQDLHTMCSLSDVQHIHLCERMTVYRMLYHLGYIQLPKEYEYRLSLPLIEAVEATKNDMHHILNEVNAALKIAHL